MTFENLLGFYRNPSKFFLRERLQLRLPDDEDPLEEQELFDLGSLAAYKIEQDLTRRSLAGEELAALEILVRAGGQFPAGETGRLNFKR